MKTKTVYKVVLKSTDGKFLSFISYLGLNSLVLQYELGKMTVPKCGKIFVFDKLEFAESFIFPVLNRELFQDKRFQMFQIMKGKAVNPKKLKRCSLPNPGSFEYFWDKLKMNIPTKTTPAGTLYCDSFTPEKVVCSTE